jgi:DNA-binding SARP family transcriptional activator
MSRMSSTVVSPSRSATRSGDGGTELQLLQHFEVRGVESRVALPAIAQRLVAFLALRNRPQHRATVAGTLWLDSPEARAAANLRTALWRTRQVAPSLIRAEGPFLDIGHDVRVDLRDVTERTHRLIADPAAADEPDVTAATLAADLLPEWYDDWVLLERERLRQLRLHGLEALCQRLAALGRYALAVEAALLAIAEEPLRESSQRVLIMTHLSEGNLGEAVRQYDAFATLLKANLGVDPTRALQSLVHPCR